MDFIEVRAHISDSETLEALSEAVKRTGLSRSAILREAMKDWLIDHGYLELWEK